MSKNNDIATIDQWIETISGSDVYPQLIAQLQKDLDRAGVYYRIVDAHTPKSLFLEVQQLLIKNCNTLLMNILICCTL